MCTNFAVSMDIVLAKESLIHTCFFSTILVWSWQAERPPKVQDSNNKSLVSIFNQV